MKSVPSPSVSSSKNKLMGDSINSTLKAKFVRGNPGLSAAVERDDFNDLLQKNREYISRLLSGQGDTLDSLTDMVDALGSKINESSVSAMNLVDDLSALDNLIDEERRKWIVQNEAEKSAELTGRSKNIHSSPARKVRDIVMD